MLMAAAEPATGGAAIIQILWPFVLMFVIFYFLLLRPQQKRQKQRNAMLQALKRGDKVVTIGGLHGTIMEITEEIVVLRVNDATKMTFDRSAISSVTSSSSAEESK